jgi:hypothetical protein
VPRNPRGGVENCRVLTAAQLSDGRGPGKVEKEAAKEEAAKENATPVFFDPLELLTALHRRHSLPQSVRSTRRCACGWSRVKLAKKLSMPENSMVRHLD